jgi:putative hydroxymethylpyrimidine transport system substrate-binding protein
MLTRPSRGRGALLAAGLISLTACVGCGSLHARTTVGPARKVVISLDGEPSALYAPIYEAQANGDFARGALDVTVDPLARGQNPLELLTSSQASMAIVSEPALLAARAAGAQVVAIGALVPGPLESLISLGTHAIATPSELAGQTVATSGTSLAAAELATVLSDAAIPPSRVRTIVVAGELNKALQKHKATATLGGFWNYDAVALKIAHQNPSVIQLDQAGVPTFSELVIAVRLEQARFDGTLLRAFLQSLTRGEAATLADPQAVASLLARINPQLSKSFELAVLRATATIKQPSGANSPFGFQNPSTWQIFGNWMHAHGLIKQANQGGLAITDEFLPGQGE